jgi:hypothetical protein
MERKGKKSTRWQHSRKHQTFPTFHSRLSSFHNNVEKTLNIEHKLPTRDATLQRSDAFLISRSLSLLGVSSTPITVVVALVRLKISVKWHS